MTRIYLKQIISCILFLCLFTLTNAQNNTLLEQQGNRQLDKTILACGDPFQLTSVPSMYSALDIHKDYIAWGDIFGDIYLYQISTNETTLIVDSDLMQNSSVSLTNRYLFYGSDDTGINAYNLVTGTNQFIYGEQDYGVQANVDNIAWVESYGNNNFEIQYVNINNLGNVRNVSNNPDRDLQLSVGPSFLTWVSESTDWKRLMMYSTLTALSEAIVVDSVPNVSGNFITRISILEDNIYYNKIIQNDRMIYSYNTQTGMTPSELIANDDDYFIQDGNSNYLVLGGLGELALLDLNTLIVSPIPNSENNGSVVMNDDIVMWEYEPGFSSNNDIYQYEIATGATSVLANSMDDAEFLVHLSDTHVVYAKGDMVNDHLVVQSVIPLNVALLDIENTTVNQNDGSIEVDIIGGTGGLTYSWSGPNNFTASTANISNLMAGTYALTVMDGTGCTAVSEAFIVDIMSNTEDLDQVNDMLVFPNPVSNILHVELPENRGEVMQMTIVDTKGKVLLLNDDLNQSTIDCSNLPSGVFVLMLHDGERQYVKRFVKH